MGSFIFDVRIFLIVGEEAMNELFAMVSNFEFFWIRIIIPFCHPFGSICIFLKTTQLCLLIRNQQVFLEAKAMNLIV